MYYEVKVKVEIEDANGKIKNVNEIYLTKSVNVTDAEVIINKEFETSKLTFEVTSVRQTKFIKVLNDN